MEALTIKGVRIGEGRPKTIIPLMGATLEELLCEARRAVAAGADCVEWRADFWIEAQAEGTGAISQVAQDLGAALPHTPFIATLRTEGQGGRLRLSGEEYARIVRAILSAGADTGCMVPDLIDIELCAGTDVVRSLVEEARRRGTRVIVSAHDFAETPCVAHMEDVLRAEAELGADVCKLAVMAHSAGDAARLMEATANVAEALDKPLLTMAMGREGAITRLAGEAFGSAMTFCSLEAASAPGQVGLLQARTALDSLHEALAEQGR